MSRSGVSQSFGHDIQIMVKRAAFRKQGPKTPYAHIHIRGITRF